MVPDAESGRLDVIESASDSGTYPASQSRIRCCRSLTSASDVPTLMAAGDHLATAAASGANDAHTVVVDDNGDENFVNDNGQTSGAILQQRHTPNQGQDAVGALECRVLPRLARGGLPGILFGERDKGQRAQRHSGQDAARQRRRSGIHPVIVLGSGHPSGDRQPHKEYDRDEVEHFVAATQD